MTRSILIAESQSAARAALRLLIDQQPELRLAGEVKDAAGLLREVAVGNCDVLLMDWYLPGLPAAQVLRLVCREQPALCVIVLSIRAEDRLPALAAGADAFIWKGESPRHLLSIIRSSERLEVDQTAGGGNQNEA